MHLFLVVIASITFCISDVSAISNPAAVPTPVEVRSAPAPAAGTPPATALRPGFLLVRPPVRSTTTTPTSPNAIVPTAVLTPSGFPAPAPAPAAVPYAGVPAVVPAADGSVILGPAKSQGDREARGITGAPSRRPSARHSSAITPADGASRVHGPTNVSSTSGNSTHTGSGDW